MVQIRAILLESNRHPHCDTHPQTDCQNVYRPTWIGRSRSLLCALLCIIYCLDIATTTTFLWFPEPMPWSVSSRPVLCTVCIRVVHSGLYSLSSMDRSISISSPHCGWHLASESRGTFTTILKVHPSDLRRPRPLTKQVLYPQARDKIWSHKKKESVFS